MKRIVFAACIVMLAISIAGCGSGPDRNFNRENIQAYETTLNVRIPSIYESVAYRKSETEQERILHEKFRVLFKEDAWQQADMGIWGQESEAGTVKLIHSGHGFFDSKACVSMFDPGENVIWDTEAVYNWNGTRFKGIKMWMADTDGIWVFTYSGTGKVKVDEKSCPE